MSDPDPPSDARLWLRHAREDLRAGQQLLAEPVGVPRQSAWFAQQAAEKALKALLIFHQRSFPYTHDLERLVRLLPQGVESRFTEFDVESLSTYAVDTRYPGFPAIDSEGARAAVETAERIVEAVRSDLDV
jgi:HEPN domain-containing protein